MGVALVAIIGIFLTGVGGYADDRAYNKVSV